VTRWHRAATRAAATIAIVALAACSTEVDPELAAEPTGSDVVRTTEFVASGSTAELLDQLVAEAGGLSEAIVANEGQRAILARIDTIWAAARPDVEEQAQDNLAEFDRTIALMHTGVDRRRPADADKAYNNLTALRAAMPTTASSTDAPPGRPLGPDRPDGTPGRVDPLAPSPFARIPAQSGPAARKLLATPHRVDLVRGVGTRSRLSASQAARSA
jgi:hypothetical protein